MARTAEIKKNKNTQCNELLDPNRGNPFPPPATHRRETINIVLHVPFLLLATFSTRFFRGKGSYAPFPNEGGSRSMGRAWPPAPKGGKEGRPRQ